MKKYFYVGRCPEPIDPPPPPPDDDDIINPPPTRK
jgi:hypothetical protein